MKGCANNTTINFVCRLQTTIFQENKETNKPDLANDFHCTYNEARIMSDV